MDWAAGRFLIGPRTRQYGHVQQVQASTACNQKGT